MSSRPEEKPSSAPDPSLQEASPPCESSPAECTNCGAVLSTPYCGTCGQRAANRVVPLWQVSNEFLEDLFDLDLRILRTLPTFFFRPGRLTVEYVHDLFSSFLLFTVLAFTNLDVLSITFSPDSTEVQREVESARLRIDSLQTALIQNTLTREPASNGSPATSAGHEGTIQALRKEIEGIEAALGPTETVLTTSEHLVNVLASPAFGESAGESAGPEPPDPTQPKLLRILHSPRDFARDMIDRAPYLMFVLVPTFALLLKGLYLRRKRLYLEHVIFSLHVHALAFIAFAISAALGAWDIGPSTSLSWILATSPFAYLFFAMRHVYGESLLSTFYRMTALLIAYGIILVGAVVLLAMLTVSLM